MAADDDFDDFDEDEGMEEARFRNLQRIRTEGLDAATDAALGLLRDPKAPAQAKSAAINAIYRVSGLFGDTSDVRGVPDAEMTQEQALRRLAEIEARLRVLGSKGKASRLLE